MTTKATEEKVQWIDKVNRVANKILHQEKSSGIVIGLSVIAAIIIANTSLKESYYSFFENHIGFIFNGSSYFNYSILHWINDGLMAIFFFSVGLELKREFVAGDLADLRKSILPIGAAIGGMVVPAIIYASLNTIGEARNGWGIPMATDIAFALAVLSILGKRVPSSLKVFLTALAIVDDLGAVIVIALFYSSNISIFNLCVGLTCALIMLIGNKIGIRNFVFYAVLGIVGVWASFLLSGVHATIAAVIAAFMIPCDVKISKTTYIKRMDNFIAKINGIEKDDKINMLTKEQLSLLQNVKKNTHKAIPPLQRLEEGMHPFVYFIILPIFAFANAGITFDFDINTLFNTNITIGVALGLLLGKVIGIVCASLLLIKFNIAHKPKEMNAFNLIGLGLLGSIGFTMSMFITSLAFENPLFITQAKIGIFIASIIGGISGFLILRKGKRQY